ncbi:glycosyl transferase family 1 [Brevibacillus agri]|uniref:Glycosyl transferase family 1 n=1 Tax=Brevibacillus agri TaxID=51101 RepID=A0A3M8B9D9_9BACL|nr:glycosyltransferase family 4 protein [Brevibacillus agri]QAV13018.1 glycosyltransferase family 1 protein [Brevibacillus agri]RNB60029.1 glycosyltransferase family 1 protein [Brevibacillus agri]GED26575.1 glycosyl transferase family 1 [Brevibacillus agri]
MGKILQICAIDQTVESLLLPLIQKLAEEGHEVHTACTDTGRFQTLRAKGLMLWPIAIKRKIEPLSNLRSILALYRLMKRERYDAVHVHTPVAAVLGRVAARLAGVSPVVYTAHGYYFHDGMSRGEYRLYYAVEKWFAKHLTDYLLVQSREDYELSVQDGFSPPERIMHLGNGVDVERRFHPQAVSPEEAVEVRSALGIGADDLVIAYVGRMVGEKGIFELLDAFSRLARESGRVRLLLVGDVSDSERDQRGKALREHCREHPQIVLTGFRQDIPQLLAASDIFVLPSHREGLPRSIIEAMAMGKPIVATNIRGCREEVTDGVNGILVEPKQSEHLYKALKKLACDARLREAYGQNSRYLAEEHFNEQHVLARQAELFAALLAAKTEPPRTEKEVDERLGQNRSIGHIP